MECEEKSGLREVKKYKATNAIPGMYESRLEDSLDLEVGCFDQAGGSVSPSLYS